MAPDTARSMRRVSARGSRRHVLREHRDEGGRERALRDEPPEEVRQAERHEEGVGRDAGAEGPGDHEVAQEAEDPAGQGGGAHHGGRARHGAPGAGRGR